MANQKRDSSQGTDYLMALFGKTMNFLQQREPPSKLDLNAKSKDMAMARQPSSSKLATTTAEAQTRFDRIAASCTPLASALLVSDLSVMQVCVSAADGFEICHVAQDSVLTSPRHSVITNLTATVAQAISTEFRLGQADYILINSLGGRVLVMQVAAKQIGLIVAVIASDASVAGSLIVNTRNTCDFIKNALDG